MTSSCTRAMKLAVPLVVLALAAACSPPSQDPGPAAEAGTGGRAAGGAGGARPGSGGTPSGGATGGASASAGSGGEAAGGTGGIMGGVGGGAAGGQGGSSTGGAGGAPPPEQDAGTPDASADVQVGPMDTGGAPPSPMGPLDFGGVGQVIPVPLQYTATPVPPIVPLACPDDITKGFTEYKDSFVVQRPRNLPASARMKYEGGIYKFWVTSSDLSHKPDSGTAPRTEARYSDISTGEHIWSGDVMFESPSKTCVFQIHNVNSPIAIYLRVVGDRMFNLSTGTTIATGLTGKWFNLKVVFNIPTREVRTYINGCLKETSRAPGTASVNKWYFKHGVYTCDSGTCSSSYKNIRLYHKGSTDTFNVKSPYP